MDMSKMGAFLQTLRREQGLTQEQLGEKLRISSKTISRWEKGSPDGGALLYCTSSAQALHNPAFSAIM